MERERSPKKISWYSVFLHLALVALSLQVVLLINRGAGARPKIEAIAAGDTVRPIAVRGLDGAERTLELAGKDRDTLLLTFTTSCPACKENVGSWVELYRRFHQRYDVVGISIGEPGATAEYVAQYDLPYPVVVPAEAASFARSYRIPAVPHTLRIAPDGTVREAWVGILSQEQLDSLAPLQASASTAVDADTDEPASRDV